MKNVGFNNICFLYSEKRCLSKSWYLHEWFLSIYDDKSSKVRAEQEMDILIESRPIIALTFKNLRWSRK